MAAAASPGWGRPAVKAITVKQPWAELIARGEKLVENRSQVFAHRGPLAIHAGQTYDSTTAARGDIWRALSGSECRDLPRGVIVATAQLVDCHATTPGCCDSRWAQYPTSPDRRVTHLVLADIERLAEPVPARGALGLWEWGSEARTVVAELCDFDGGPLHHTEARVSPDPDGTLPLVLVTDEGDYWVTYVLLSGHAARERPTYSYAGGATAAEVALERRVPAADGGDRG